MFFDDVELVRSMVAKYSARPPYVECGGLSDPCIASYDLTIKAMREARDTHGYSNADVPTDVTRAAQMCRYLQIHRPLEASCPGYRLENPETGGLPLERLAEKYDPARGTGIGTAILLSVLEHVADPFEAIDRLRDVMTPGGLVIVSVPWAFPTHYGPEDNWRISESGLRHIFSPPAGSGESARWTILESGKRLDVPAEAGVLDGQGRAQIVQSAYIVARAA
jgi:hypothetical protein